MMATGLHAEVVWQAEHISDDVTWSLGFIEASTAPTCEWQPAQLRVVPSKIPPVWQRSQLTFK